MCLTVIQIIISITLLTRLLVLSLRLYHNLKLVATHHLHHSTHPLAGFRSAFIPQFKVNGHSSLASFHTPVYMHVLYKVNGHLSFASLYLPACWVWACFYSTKSMAIYHLHHSTYLLAGFRPAFSFSRREHKVNGHTPHALLVLLLQLRDQVVTHAILTPDKMGLQ